MTRRFHLLPPTHTRRFHLLTPALRPREKPTSVVASPEAVQRPGPRNHPVAPPPPPPPPRNRHRESTVPMVVYNA
ncbi:unnamed protein product [Linum tenue]|uniref:Uncharacterized protein n=1 Tax=Linum tenue TaxID=586396 RepID=A0AAV0MW99_9ROSI|nr:unnamed protein product [Linum tenue]